MPDFPFIANLAYEMVVSLAQFRFIIPGKLQSRHVRK